jgi:hypothetical protein
MVDRNAVAFPLRLPASLKDIAQDLAEEDGISLNHFITLAVAEKISRLESDLSSGRLCRTRRRGFTVVSGPGEFDGAFAGRDSQ